MIRAITALCSIALLGLACQTAAGETRRLLEFSPAPADNPLKGLVPYSSNASRDSFPHSMEFSYIPLSTLVSGYDTFDWQPLEALLDEVAGRGNQTIFRVYLEYPGKTGAIPDFLLKDGLAITRWNYNRNPSQPVETPDYANANLRRLLKNFISGLGCEYDGDPRIGFITAGLLGLWGEWHTHPNPGLFASKAVQQEVMDAYESAFKTTHVLLRYPVGNRHARLARNSDRPFGYHDDSFAWTTLDSGNSSDAWFFIPILKAAGPEAEAKWKTRPIGGEIRPEAWGLVFDQRPGDQRIQDFRQCVDATHVTWLMDSGMFRRERDADRIKQAEQEVRRMGYEFHAPAVTFGAVINGKLNVRLEVENRGVAPFYYDWKPEYGLLINGRVVKTFAGTGKLTEMLPGDRPRVWVDRLDVCGIDPGLFTLAVRVPNPMQGGTPLRFANATRDDASGWLFLGDVLIR